MNPELKAKWIAALRSGEIEQGKGQLGSPENEMCCLGVLCHVQNIDMQRAEPTEDIMGNSEVTYDDVVDDYVPKKWAYREYPSKEQAAGLTPSQCTDLADMNDHENSFAVIADWIEENIDATA